MNKYVLLIFSILSLVACDNTSYLEQIYVKDNWDHDGILYLTESANVGNIADDSLDFYLSKEEIKDALDSIVYQVDIDGNDYGSFLGHVFTPVDTLSFRKVDFKKYGEIYKNTKFKIVTIYVSPSLTKGRCHQFYLRTYQLNNQLIDSNLFAVWDDKKALYFSGELTHDLKIKRLNESGELLSIFQIMDDGKIMKM